MSTNTVNKQAMLVFLVFVIALASGIMLGHGLAKKQTAEAATAAAANEHDPGKRLAIQLGLSAEQQEAQKAIFDRARLEGQRQDGLYQENDKNRDEEIARILPPDIKAAYDKVLEQHKARREQLGKERDEVFKQTQEELKGILTDEQKAKYDEIMKSWPQRGPGRRGGRGVAATAPASGPASMPTTSAPASEPASRPEK